MKIPLHLKIKKKVHQDIAYAQDLIVDRVYAFFPKAVLHGGTAIWRCYNGNRFSEDIDMYLQSKEKINDFFNALRQIGFTVKKQRVKERSLYSVLEFNRIQVRFECVFIKSIKVVLKEYEMVDGNLINVYTLSPEDLVTEKIAACISRRKVRDLYDIFYLLRFIKGLYPKDLKKVNNISMQDKENLSTIILSGPIPTIEEMKKYIETWEP